MKEHDEANAAELLDEAVALLPAAKVAAVVRSLGDEALGDLVRGNRELRLLVVAALVARVHAAGGEEQPQKRGQGAEVEWVAERRWTDLEERVLKVIRAALPGGGSVSLSSTYIAAKIGKNRSQVTRALGKLVDAGLVTRTGSRKSARYHPA